LLGHCDVPTRRERSCRLSTPAQEAMKSILPHVPPGYPARITGDPEGSRIASLRLAGRFGIGVKWIAPGLESPGDKFQWRLKCGWKDFSVAGWLALVSEGRARHHRLARGIDETEVIPDRPMQSDCAHHKCDAAPASASLHPTLRGIVSSTQPGAKFRELQFIKPCPG
jgi:hypothetical protein